MTIHQSTRPGLRSAILAAVAAVALTAPLALAPASAAAAPAGIKAAAPYCGITWGSLAKNGQAYPSTAPAPDPGGISGVRAGRHACFDRLVIDLDEPGTTWFVQYVDQVTTGGQGAVVPTAGGARLQISVMGHEYSLDGEQAIPLYAPADDTRVTGVTGFRTFRQVTYGGSFEALHDFGLGVRARLPFRVFVLAGPGDGSRLVIDVAHRWS